jgi:hypothetical protein
VHLQPFVSEPFVAAFMERVYGFFEGETMQLFSSTGRVNTATLIQLLAFLNNREQRLAYGVSYGYEPQPEGEPTLLCVFWYDKEFARLLVKRVPSPDDPQIRLADVQHAWWWPHTVH